MTIRLDPEEHETAALNELLPAMRGLHVLEVGCGDGRLTCKYASQVGSVLAVDPDRAALVRFRDTIPAALSARVELRTARVDELDLDDGAVDLVLLSWSL
jgi:ubiquinone/menaquinone biosynthesis C-methylase UbiE